MSERALVQERYSEARKIMLLLIVYVYRGSAFFGGVPSDPRRGRLVGRKLSWQANQLINDKEKIRDKSFNSLF